MQFIMKRGIFTIILWILVWSSAVAQPAGTAFRGIAKPRVDRRLELVTIVARLAGLREYQSELVPLYTDSVDAWFAPHKEHPVVLHMKELRRSKGLAYDALPVMAAYLTEPPRIRPRVSLTETLPDWRWGLEGGTEFIRLLDRFYKDARCDEFFARQDSLYRKVETYVRSVFPKLDSEWFYRFFGEEARFGMIPVIRMMLGTANYGGDISFPDSTKEIYAFMGGLGLNRDKEPVIMSNRMAYFNTLIHEFAHSFVNPVLITAPELSPLSSALFRAEADAMRSQGYGDGYGMIYETFTRATVIRYFMEYADSAAVADALHDEISRCHFIWMPEAVELLGEYEADREKYPDFRSFMPRIVEWCKEVVAQMDTIRACRAAEAEILRERALKVVAIEPFGNGAQDVDPDLTEITIRFDRPLIGKDYAFAHGPGGKATGVKFTGWNGYSEDKTSLTMKVELQPNREYEFRILRNYGFVTPDGVRLYENYLVKFRTRAE